MTEKLLTRQAFAEAVFSRDSRKCVICRDVADAAHHILERRLFKAEGEQGGYFVSNGSSLCVQCHIDAETTRLSVADIRLACGITKPRRPEHLYEDVEYTKWGDPILSDGRRGKGELFFDESVQKILAKGDVLHLYRSALVKYPRTYHVAWSPGMHGDDRMVRSMAAFQGRRVIVTRKMDGENTTVYRNDFHARSLDGRSHPSRDLAKAEAAKWQHDLPEDWRACLENLYAVHSIAYSDLPSVLLGFQIWNKRNFCLSWDETLEWFELLGIVPVEVLYDGIYDEGAIRKLHDPARDDAMHEGWVMRIADGFAYGDFASSVAKYVRAGHVATTKHNWQTQRIVPNGIAGIKDRP